MSSKGMSTGIEMLKCQMDGRAVFDCYGNGYYLPGERSTPGRRS